MYFLNNSTSRPFVDTEKSRILTETDARHDNYPKSLHKYGAIYVYSYEYTYI